MSSALTLSLLIAGMTMLPATVQAACVPACVGGEACYGDVCRARCGGLFPGCAAPTRCTPAQGAVRYCRGVAVGEACTSEPDCLGDTYCDNLTDADAPVCAARVAMGEACTESRQCTSTQCTGGVCVQAPCRQFGQRCGGNNGTCCQGAPSCELHIGDGSYRCTWILEQVQCTPIGVMCDATGQMACCNNGVCNMGVCVIPNNPPPPPPPPASSIKLLEPIGNISEIPTTNASGFGPFFFFFNLLYPYFVGLGAAIAVLMGLIGGIQVMTAGGDQGRRSAGVNRFLMSLGGLVLLLLSSLILNLLNPTFFK